MYNINKYYHKDANKLKTQYYMENSNLTEREKTYEGNYFSRRFRYTFISIDQSNIEAVAPDL